MKSEPIIQISAIEHFVYCPRQCALIHCDGVWSDNAHTVRGVRAHRRVDSGLDRQERGRRANGKAQCKWISGCRRGSGPGLS